MPTLDRMLESASNMPIKLRRLYHDRDTNGRQWGSCIKHRFALGPLSQDQAEAIHGNTICPECQKEVAQHGGSPLAF